MKPNRLALLLLLLGCASRSATVPPPSPSEPAMPSSDDRVAPPSTEGADVLIYRFQDASVPPPYHRSYTITATAQRIERVVDSYGDEVERQEAAITPEQLEELLAVFERSVARRATALDNPGCTGGTGEAIEVQRDGESLFRASVYHCGGQDAGDLVGDPGALRDAMLALIPR